MGHIQHFNNEDKSGPIPSSALQIIYLRPTGVNRLAQDHPGGFMALTGLSIRSLTVYKLTVFVYIALVMCHVCPRQSLQDLSVSHF